MSRGNRDKLLAQAIIGGALAYPDKVFPGIEGIITPEDLPLTEGQLLRAAREAFEKNGTGPRGIEAGAILAEHPDFDPELYTICLDLASSSDAAIADAWHLARLRREEAIISEVQGLIESHKREPGSPAVQEKMEALRFELESFEVEPGQCRHLQLLAKILEDPDALKPPAPVVDRLAWEGRTTLLAAREKRGKSTLASGAAAAVSAAYDFLGMPVLAGTVLYVGLEDHPLDIASRLMDFGADPDNVHLLPVVDNALAELSAAVRQIKPGLIIIDTLSAFVADMDLDPSSSADWTPIMARLNRIARDTAAAVLILHHATKAGGTYRDSTAIGASVDVILEMSEDQEETVRKIGVRGRWKMDDFQIQLIDSPEGGLRYELARGGLSLDARVLAYITENPGCSGRQLRENIDGGTHEVTRARDRLLEQGVIENQGTGNCHSYYPKKAENWATEPLVPLNDKPEPSGTTGTPSNTAISTGIRTGEDSGGTTVPTPRGVPIVPPTSKPTDHTTEDEDDKLPF